jgi:single-stranded DNA-binding protein
MQININHTVVSGTLSGRPTLTTMRSGEVTCVMRLVCTRHWRDPLTGEWNHWKDTFWVRTFGGHARAASRYLRDGRAVAVQGHLSYHHEPDQAKRFEIVASHLQFLGDTRPTSTSTSTHPNTPREEEIIDEDNIVSTQEDTEIFATGPVW